MRYTTLVDITEMPCYRSTSARLLYLHLVCRAGYHKEDRDQVRASIRGLAYSVGLTLSATKHALALLKADGLVRWDAGIFYVTTFVQPVLAAKRSASQIVDTPAQQREEQAREAEVQKLRDELDRLRRWYKDAGERGDTTSQQEIKAEASRVKNRLKQLQP